MLFLLSLLVHQQAFVSYVFLFYSAGAAGQSLVSYAFPLSYTGDSPVFCFSKILSSCFFLSFCQPHNANVVPKCLTPILIILGHNDQWPSPQMSSDPWPRQRSFKVTGVKYRFFPSKCIFFYKQHVILTWFGHMTGHQSVSMGSSRIWGQRSLRGHFRSEFKNL